MQGVQVSFLVGELEFPHATWATNKIQMEVLLAGLHMKAYSTVTQNTDRVQGWLIGKISNLQFLCLEEHKAGW